MPEIPEPLLNFLRDAGSFAVLALIVIFGFFLIFKLISKSLDVRKVQIASEDKKLENEGQENENRAETARLNVQAQIAGVAREEARSLVGQANDQRVSDALVGIMGAQEREQVFAASSEERIIMATRASEDRVSAIMEKQLKLFIEVFGEPPTLSALEKALERVSAELKSKGLYEKASDVDQAAAEVGAVSKKVQDAKEM